MDQGVFHSAEPQSSAGRSLAKERLGRLYTAIEAGMIDGTGPSPKNRPLFSRVGRDKVTEALDYATRMVLRRRFSSSTKPSVNIRRRKGDADLLQRCAVRTGTDVEVDCVAMFD